MNVILRFYKKLSMISPLYDSIFLGFLFLIITFLLFGSYYVKLSILFASGAFLIKVLLSFLKINRRQKIILGVVSWLMASLFVQGFLLMICASILIFGALAWYHGVLLFTKDKVQAVFFMVVIVLVMGNIPGYAYVHELIIGITLLAIIFLLRKKKQFLDNLYQDYCDFESQSFYDLCLWFILFFCTIFLGMYTKGGFCAVDSHPIYELSVGQSYKNNIFNAMDLSYVGKIMRYHFLATKIPFVFSQIFKNDSILSVAYFLSPLFLLLILCLLLNAFVFPVKMKPPLMLLFFTPFLFPVEVIASLFKTTLNFTLSFFMATILVIMGCYFFLKKRYFLFSLTAMMLILTKVSFFFPLIGGSLFFLLRKKENKKMLLLAVSSLVSFLLFYYFFLSGAHIHNLWIAGPFVGTFYLLNRNSYAYFAVLLQLVLFVYSWFIYYKNEDDFLLFCSSTSIIGILGSMFLAEISEFNSYQFYVAVYFFLSVILWNLLQKMNILLKPSRFFEKLFTTAGWYFLFIFFLFNINRPFLMGVNYIKSFSNKHTSVIANDCIEAYSFLERQDTVGAEIFLFSKHYEFDAEFLRGNCGDNIRSALSSMQAYNEGLAWKGILMQPDYVDRFVKNIRFYNTFVQLSNLSKKRLNKLVLDLQNQTQEALSLSVSNKKYSGFKASVLHKLSFGKEWFKLNQYDRVFNQIGQVLKTSLKMTEAEALMFLKEENVSYIVLEQRDVPTDFLKQFTKKIFSNTTNTILQIDKDELHCTVL